MTLITMAEAIHNATGWTGPELQQATFVAAAIFADAVGRKDIGDHFTKRAAETGTAYIPARPESDPYAAHHPMHRHPSEM